MENKKPLNPLLRARIVWVALVTSTFYYAIILLVQTKPVQAVDEAMVQMMSAVALGSLVLSLILPELIFKRALQQTPANLSLEDATKLYLVPLILRLALTESICIYGLILALRYGIRFYFPFWAVALLAMISAYPTTNTIEKKIAKARQFPQP